MMKRRLLAVLLAVILIFALCACGETAQNDSAPSKESAKPASSNEVVSSFTPHTHRICAGASSVAVLLDDGTVQCTLDSSDDQYIAPRGDWKTWTDIVDIDMNEEILAAVKADGTVVWDGGRVREYEYLNDPETMGVIDKWENVVQVSAGFDCIAALRADGTAEVTGGIWTEDLSETSGFTQVAVYDAFFALRADGTVYCYSPWVYEGQTWEYDVSAWTDITQISAGFDHAVGLKSDGTVVATGNNDCGQCEVSDWTDIVQVYAGRDHTFGLKSDGTVVWCGESLMNGEELALGGWTDIVEVSGFFDHTIGLKSDGSIVYAGAADRYNPISATSIKTK